MEMESEQEVIRIARTVARPSATNELSHCTLEDRNIWLRRTPVFYAHELSASVIPSFKALTGDGMSIATFNRHLPQVERRYQEVLQELECARLTVKGRIQDEYVRMKYDESIAGDALARTREMLEEIIDLAPPNIQCQINPSVELAI